MAGSRQLVIHTMGIGEELGLTIRAGERYSMQRIAVNPGETYIIACMKDQRWVDLIIPSSPDGYTNFFAGLFGLRVRNVKCFCLCGAWNERDEGAFAIGTQRTMATAIKMGTLSFFANDVLGYEWNNCGSVEIRIKRTV